MQDQTPGSGGDIEIGGGTGGTGGTSASVLSSGFASGVDKGELLAIGVIILAVLGIIFLIKSARKTAEPEKVRGSSGSSQNSADAAYHQRIGEIQGAVSAGMTHSEYVSHLDRIDRAERASK